MDSTNNSATDVLSIKPLTKGTPRARRGGGMKGGSPATIARRQQLQTNPGEWFVWKEGAKNAADSGQALRTLMGLQTLKGIDRKTMPYEATGRINENRTWDIYVRYVGEQRQHA